MKFKPKDAQYPQTFFLGADAIRLGPDDVYETNNPGIIAAAEAHSALERVKEAVAPKPKAAAPKPKAAPSAPKQVQKQKG